MFVYDNNAGSLKVLRKSVATMRRLSRFLDRFSFSVCQMDNHEPGPYIHEKRIRSSDGRVIM